MRHIVKELNTYLNFNESKEVQVTKIEIDGSYLAGISFYKEACNCSLFLKEATFTYVIKGQKYMLVNKKEYHLQEGDLLYIPRNSVVFTDIPKTKQPFQSFNMVLSDNLLQSLDHSKQFSSLQLKNVSGIISQNRSVINTFNSFLKYYPFNHPDKIVTNAYKKLLLYILNSEESRFFQNNPPDKRIKSPEMQTISDVLIECIYQPVSLYQMASRSNMSLATFKRKFTHAFEEPPKTWIRNIRLQAAYFHLKTNQESVSEISSFVGFNNFAHFSYAFKKYFHITPSALLLKN